MTILVLGWVAALAVTDAAPQATTSQTPACCYTNPRFSGVCSVEPAAGETCASVLAYLNAPQSQGKTYCATTTVRGGWKARRCAPARKGTPTPTTTGVR